MARLEVWKKGAFLLTLEQVSFLKGDYPGYKDLNSLSNELARALELTHDSRKTLALTKVLLEVDNATNTLLIVDTVLAVLSTGKELQ